MKHWKLLVGSLVVMLMTGGGFVSCASHSGNNYRHQPTHHVEPGSAPKSEPGSEHKDKGEPGSASKSEPGSEHKNEPGSGMR